MSAAEVFIGVDVGTSGCRAIAIDAGEQVIASTGIRLPPIRKPRPGIAEQDAEIWWIAFCAVTQALIARLDGYRPTAICADGTSGTLVITDPAGNPVAPGIMYNDQRGLAALDKLNKIVPADSPVLSASSSLAKLLVAKDQGIVNASARAMHQAEWILGRLAGRFDKGDEHNCLKLGYDARTGTWPEWISTLGIQPDRFPQVVPAGTPLGQIAPAVTDMTGLPECLSVYAGTTDSTAAALAAGASSVGDGVTSLGSTLVLKILSEKPVNSPEFGVYSHRIDNYWLVGGASNSGGSVLRQFFSDEETARMAKLLDFNHPTGLDYYPLPRPGERFPINDPQLAPRLAPRPKDAVRFFQALLEGVMRIEETGYETLRTLGAGYPRRIFSTGGGSRNVAWTDARAKLLGIPVTTAQNPEAAFGAALIAKRGMLRQPLLSHR